MITRYVPIVHWLPRYRRRWWRGDLIAGLSVWALTISHALVYADVIGLPLQSGLYAALAGLILYAIFGSSRHIITGPALTITIVTGAAVGHAAVVRPEEIVALASAIALAAGLIYFVLRIFRLSWLTSFLPNSVLAGFIAGLAVAIAMSQFKTIFGLSGSGMSALRQLGQQLERQPQSILITTLLGAGAFVLLIGLKRFVPKSPAVLVVVMLGAFLGLVVNWQALGVTTVGNIPAGLPALSLPAVSRSQLDIVLVAAVAVVFISFAETMASAEISADRTYEQIDPNQELLALGIVNVGSGLFSGFGVDGTLPKTVSNMNNGAKTQMASLIQAALVVLTLLLAGPLLSGLPWAILGAIVILTVIGLIRLKTFRRFYRLSRSEFWLAVITGLAVIVLGPLWGVLIGILLSVFYLVGQASHPDIPVLGQKPGRDIYLSVADHPDYETYPGLVILRLHGPLYYPATNGLRDRLRELTMDVDPAVKEVILDLGETYYVDLEGADMLKSIWGELDNRDVELHLAQVQKKVLKFLAADKVDEVIGSDHIHASLAEAVEAFNHGQ